MTHYERLITEVEKEGAAVVELNCGTNKRFGKCYNNKVFINSNMPETQKTEVLAEEYGHFKTTVGDITDLTDIRNLKMERIARTYAYEILCSMDKLIAVINKGATNLDEICDALTVSPKFFHEAINHYKCKYGLYYEYNNYIFHFDDNAFYIHKKQNYMEG